jgi:hypothetical protein
MQDAGMSWEEEMEQELEGIDGKDLSRKGETLKL